MAKIKEPRLMPPILMCRRLPFRLCAQEVADLGGFRDKDAVGILVAHRRLPVLGGWVKGHQMWFDTSEVLARFAKSSWLENATKLLSEVGQSRRGKG